MNFGKISLAWELRLRRLDKASDCWRRLKLDSACRYFFDRGLVANV